MSAPGPAEVRRRRPMRRRAVAIAALLAFAVACANVEDYLPDVVEITGTIVQVAAGIFLPEYASAVDVLMATLTPAAVSMATTWGEHRRQQRELARLEEIETQMQGDYAALASTAKEGGGEGWGSAAPEEAAWGTVHDAVTAAPGAGPELAAVTPEAEEAPWPPPLANAASPWGEHLTGKSVPADDAPLVVALDVALLRATDDGMAEIADGEVLRDADGAAGGDRLRVFFRPEQEAFVYVVAVDARARVQPLFPASWPDRHNPVPAGRGVLLPGPGAWYGLDAHRGVQHVFFYASVDRRPDLERQLAAFASRPVPEPRRAGEVTEPTVVEAGEIRGRGLTGVRPVEMIPIPGGGGELRTERAEGPPGGDLVVTRWFRHQ